MASDEKTPQTPTRRITRSSSATPSKPSHGAANLPSPTTPPAAAGLPFPDGVSAPFSLDDLFAILPGRRSQILELLRAIGPHNSPMLPSLLCGGSSTGKTSTVLQVFRLLRRRFVYASCRSCYNPRVLFETVLNQLLSHSRTRENGYSSAKRCEKASDFVNLLRDALVQAKNTRRDSNKKSCSRKEFLDDGNNEMIYLIFDNVELIRSWEKGSVILPLLFRIHDLLKIPDVGLIYISRAMPDAYYTMTGSLEPVCIRFTDYTLDDLHCILMRNQVNPKLYECFLSVVLKPFSRVTRRVDELAIALKPLFKKYCDPLKDLSVVPDDGMKRRLFDHLQPHLTASLNEIFEIPTWPSVEVKKEAIPSKRGSAKKFYGKDISSELDIHMSVSAKYLLVSAFLASRNPATLDAALFDSTGGSNSRKRKRKSLKTSLDKQEDMAEEVLMKGPGSFPLERLLAIFQCITSVMECAADDNLEDGKQTDGSNVWLISDVLLQLSTLCKANFICKNSSCPLEGSIRYRSMVDEDMALKVARSIKFPLSKYIYRR